MTVLAWMNKAVADHNIDAAIEQLEKPFSVEGLEPLYTAGAAKTAAAAIEWYDFRLNAKLPELEAPQHVQELLADLRTEPKDWTFDFFALTRRRNTYTNAIDLLKAGRRKLNPCR